MRIAFVYDFELRPPFYLLLGQADFWWMLPMTLATGFAAGSFSQTLPNSMKADVIDLDELQSGENRAALFFSAWSFAQKAAASFGILIATVGLDLVGFQARAGAMNTEEHLLGLRFLFSTFPSVFFVIGAMIVWNYPITEEKHAEIRAQLGKTQAPRGSSHRELEACVFLVRREWKSLDPKKGERTWVGRC